MRLVETFSSGTSDWLHTIKTSRRIEWSSVLRMFKIRILRLFNSYPRMKPDQKPTTGHECSCSHCTCDTRNCPECGLKTIKGMPGGRDATCTNCGYKDPCCYDWK